MVGETNDSMDSNTCNHPDNSNPTHGLECRPIIGSWVYLEGSSNIGFPIVWHRFSGSTIYTDSNNDSYSEDN